MATCRTGCPTQDHATYAACLRDANVQVSDVINSPAQPAWEKTKTDLPLYRAARANGIQPGGTTAVKVREAEQATRLLGRPYNAEKDPPAHMIVNKKTAQFVNSED